MGNKNESIFKEHPDYCSIESIIRGGGDPFTNKKSIQFDMPEYLSTNEIVYTHGDLTGERHIKAIYALCETAEKLFDADRADGAVKTLRTAWGEFEEMVNEKPPYSSSLLSPWAEPSQEQADTAGRLASAMVRLGQTDKLVDAMQHAFKQEQQSPYSTGFQTDKKLEDMGYL